jgi:hypothetical protein
MFGIFFSKTGSGDCACYKSVTKKLLPRLIWVNSEPMALGVLYGSD